MATNLWTLPPDRGEETVQVLHQSQRVRVEKIVSYGQVSPEGFWYDQPEDEWVSVLEGSAVLRAGEQLVHLSRGGELLFAGAPAPPGGKNQQPLHLAVRL